MFVDRGLLRTFVLLVNQFFCTLQSQVPLLAVFSLIHIDQLAKQTSLTAMLGNQLGTFLIGFLKS